MKVTLIRVSRTERDKTLAFIREVNDCEDTAAILKEGYYNDELTIAAVGRVAMDYTMRKAECTFDDYSSSIIK